ncbi:hypothetical protein AB3329_07805 [Streptococcus sp. H31]|uniref:hypothetical protein n=1 Tax=Streptococcus huangxiaojuni TaxID=3237239 RepID=UPI0034A1F2E1
MQNLFTVLILASGFGAWYFIKKQPNKKYRNYSIGLLIISFVAFGLISDRNKAQQETAVETIVQQTTVAKTTEVTQTTEATTEATTTESNEKKYTEEANAEFANYLAQNFSEQLADTNISGHVEYAEDLLIYIYVPQDFKYASNAMIQKTADNVLSVKNNLFSRWAQENGYKESDNPILYLRSEDGTDLAEESVWNGTMKRKIDN